MSELVAAIAVNAEPPDRRARTRWVAIIVALLLGNVCAMVVLTVAARSGPRHVAANYYERAAHYDDAMAQATRNQQLGWHAVVTLAGGALELVLTDRSGAPLADARVHVTGAHRSAPDRAIARDLVAAGAGVYRTPFDARVGWYDLELTITQASDKFAQALPIWGTP